VSARADVAIEIDSEIPSSSDRLHRCAAAQTCSRLEQAWSESGADGEQMNTRALLSSRGSTVDD